MPSALCLCEDSSPNGLLLARFKGRPGELSPKARFFMFAGRVWPSRFRYVPLFCLVHHFSLIGDCIQLGPAL